MDIIYACSLISSILMTGSTYDPNLNSVLVNTFCFLVVSDISRIIGKIKKNNLEKNLSSWSFKLRRTINTGIHIQSLPIEKKTTSGKRIHQEAWILCITSYEDWRNVKLICKVKFKRNPFVLCGFPVHTYEQSCFCTIRNLKISALVKTAQVKSSGANSVFHS